MISINSHTKIISHITYIAIFNLSWENSEVSKAYQEEEIEPANNLNFIDQMCITPLISSQLKFLELKLLNLINTLENLITLQPNAN